MPRILITGANSFIGRSFIRSSKFKIIEEVSLLQTTPPEIDFSRYDVILHLAAIVHQSRRIEKNEYFRINRDLCIDIANKAKEAGVKQFIFLSTVKVYGEFGNRKEPWNERSHCNPTDYYGQSKLEAENRLTTIESPDFIVSIVRSPVVYGEGVKAKILSLVKLVERFPVLPLGKIKNLRNFTYVENMVAFIDRVIEKKVAGTFIVMDDTPLSTSEFVKQIADGLGRKRVFFKLPELIINLGKMLMPQYFERIYGSLLLDNQVTKDKLNFTPPYSIETGLKKMLDSYKKDLFFNQKR